MTKKRSKPFLRTDKAIVDAFITCSMEKPFEQLTVQDIITQAGVSRYTFYTHFHDKYEIAERIQQEMYQAFVNYMEQLVPQIESQPLDYHRHNMTLDETVQQFMQENFIPMQSIGEIHTDTIDIGKKMRGYFHDSYLRNNETRKTLPLEAEIYGSVITAISEFSYQQNAPVTSEEIFESNIRVMAQSIGMHNMDRIEKLIADLKQEMYQ